MNCRFVHRQDVLLENSAVATHLFRIVQEAVMNAIKAGKAKKIHIRFFGFQAHKILIIGDDGIGFDPATMRKGMGLKIMDYRARIISASLQLQARRKKGTLVACTFYAHMMERAAARG